METNSEYYIDLITRYFCGESTPDEIRMLEEWVKASPENATVFSEYHKTWKSFENNRLTSSIDLDHEWNNLLLKLNINKKELLNSEPRQLRIKSQILNRKSKILSLSLRIAAISLLLLIPAYFIYQYFTTPSEQRVAALEMMEQTLPDGTVVTLNAGATLTYPDRFEGSFRQVALQGEAWFEVARDKAKPFIISAGNARVQVVGTSFFMNTSTYRDTKEIILSTGVVKVYYEDRPGEASFLLPGEKAELTSNGYAIIKSSNEDENFLAWKTKRMVFNNAPLNEVVALLSKVYRTNIRLSGDHLSDCRITTTFDRQSLESVLNVLKATLELHVRDTGAGIELSGHGCIKGK